MVQIEFFCSLRPIFNWPRQQLHSTRILSRGIHLCTVVNYAVSCSTSYRTGRCTVSIDPSMGHRSTALFHPTNLFN
jgi:hypothetical protein